MLCKQFSMRHAGKISSYKGSIKTQVRETCQSGARAILVRLKGGPITRIEACSILSTTHSNTSGMESWTSQW
jgi:hypothetical protein